MSPEDDGIAFVWMNRAAGVAVGLFVAGALTLAWGDSRYARKAEFEEHRAAQAKLEAHDADDHATYALKSDLQAHIQTGGHQSTGIALSAIQAQLAAIQTDLAWMKAEILSKKK